MTTCIFERLQFDGCYVGDLLYKKFNNLNK